MKKIIYLIISIILLIYINGCTGYKPIYSSSNFQFEFTDYSIKGNKKLSNKIYSKLYRVFKSKKDNLEARSVHITIETIDKKHATVKNSAGKILEYKVVSNKCKGFVLTPGHLPSLSGLYSKLLAYLRIAFGYLKKSSIQVVAKSIISPSVSFLIPSLI